jgi:hypothetical protein
MDNRYKYKKIQRLGFAFFLGVILIWNGSTIVSQSQDFPPEQVAAMVYEKIQDLPSENQYISTNNNEPATDNTLISRLVRYHIYTKDRFPNYRLDWQLTFADYLGVNEVISLDNYPGNTTLKTNPLESDRAAISKLTRTQRNQIIDTLLSIYNPQAVSKPERQEEVTPPPSTPANPNSQPQLPKPGDADLLR